MDGARSAKRLAVEALAKPTPHVSFAHSQVRRPRKRKAPKATPLGKGKKKVPKGKGIKRPRYLVPLDVYVDAGGAPKNRRAVDDAVKKVLEAAVRTAGGVDVNALLKALSESHVH
jgi:hypothetical protein